MRTTPGSPRYGLSFSEAALNSNHISSCYFFFVLLRWACDSLLRSLFLTVSYQRVPEVARHPSIQAWKEVAADATHLSSAQTSPHLRGSHLHHPISRWGGWGAALGLAWINVCFLTFGLRRYLLEEEKVEELMLSGKDTKLSPTSDIDTQREER